MAGMVRITSTGEIIIGTKTLVIDNLVFKAPDDIVDIDGSSVLNRAGIVSLTDFNTLTDKVTLNEETIPLKADKSYVDGILLNKADISEVILKSDLSTIQTETPIISGSTSVNEFSTVNYTIDNYNSTFIYLITCDNGEVTLNNDGTFDVTFGEVISDAIATIEAKAIEPGMLTSNAVTLNVNVINIPLVDDQVLINPDFTTYVGSSSGFVTI